MVGLTRGGKTGISVSFEFMPIFKEICSHTEIFLRCRKQYTPFYFGVFGKRKTDAYQQKHKDGWRPSLSSIDNASLHDYLKAFRSLLT